ncbi:MAG: carboxylating nicotinate-nucleotide diphosphorylase, partial [Candidatus Sericytochromatia bacterium]
MEKAPHALAAHGDGLPLHPFLTEPIVRRALEEDLAWGDVSAWGAVPADKQAKGVLLAKAPGVIAGLPIARQVYALLDPAFTCEALVEEGMHVEPGVPIARLSGSARTLLSGERVALNFVQRLSGIATKTRAHVEALSGFNTQLVDTRKTTPGLRLLEKYAVRVGGGRNQRLALWHGILIKENHIAAAGGVAAALQRAQALQSGVDIQIEVETLEQLQQALEAGAASVLLDN